MFLDGISALGDDDLADALTAAICGDRAGFAALWRWLQPPLLRYLRVVAGDAAEDVASETWLQVARDIGRFAGQPTAFRVWLFRIARHRAIDEHRRARRRRDGPRAPEAVGGTETTARDVALDALERADTQWALRLIASLAPDQAEAVMLRVVAGLDVAQTAAILGKRPGAVRIATMRGLRRLAAHPEVANRRSPAGRRAWASTGMAEAPEAEGV
ncbi:MAG: RNA polymerase sigma factor [Micromonosporaceae bacterium]|nr:RNA polymerase sigma factor [Micromonosporaceae bacterium]